VHGIPDRPAAARALLVEGVHPDAERILTEAGWQTHTVSHAPDEAELVELLHGVRLLGIRSTTNVSASVLATADSLESVGAFCIGTNQIDLDAAAGQGAAVFNAPFSNTRSVVELAIAEIIMLMRRLPGTARNMYHGLWEKSATGAHEVRGRRLGIVGYGNIGSQLSVVAEALGMSVMFYDVADRLALGNARQAASMAELLAESDVVTLHVDGRPANAELFGAPEFARMRPGSIFLNLSRGFVIDHTALAENLEAGHLAGAAVEVFPEEPRARREQFDSKLRGAPNVMLTPHIGGSTEEAQEDIGHFVATKLCAYQQYGDTALSVNLPELVAERHEGSTRLAHLHRNVPGTLAAINRVIAERDINVVGQQLATRGELGYAVTDVRDIDDAATLRDLYQVPGTVRVRRPARAEMDARQVGERITERLAAGSGTAGRLGAGSRSATA